MPEYKVVILIFFYVIEDIPLCLWNIEFFFYIYIYFADRAS